MILKERGRKEDPLQGEVHPPQRSPPAHFQLLPEAGDGHPREKGGEERGDCHQKAGRPQMPVPPAHIHLLLEAGDWYKREKRGGKRGVRQ